MDNDWFRASVDYWRNVDETVDGMLGGYTTLHAPDIRDSRAFLDKHIPITAPNGLAMDVGAGIGRISVGLLTPRYSKVSVVESDSRFVIKAVEALKESLHRTYNCRLQDYKCVESQAYDLIWIQWVLMYASDEDLIEFLDECKRTIKPGGFIAVKENTLSSEREPDVDTNDHSLVRSDGDFRRIFSKANLKIVADAKQTNFPSSVYPVRMYLLQLE